MPCSPLLGCRSPTQLSRVVVQSGDMEVFNMSVNIDYTTIAVIAAASGAAGGFFGAFGTELAKYIIGEVKRAAKVKKDASHT